LCRQSAALAAALYPFSRGFPGKHKKEYGARATLGALETILVFAKN
jgi:hypothetical protein